MPWRGAEEPGEFPTLGYVVADWIQTFCIVPDRADLGKPLLLTDEQINNLLWTYRLQPNAKPEDGSMAFNYYGTQLVRPQKWGKDPFGAAQVCCQALGPVRFAGWDADGEPVGAEMPTPWIQCAGNAEEQTDNTWRPILTMLREGPLNMLAGLDVGETRVNLPSSGRIEPVTASARARQGARVTYVTMTESHLMTETSGGLKLARTLKRNCAGMDGRWLEITNAWDPSENSAAQQTHEAKAPGVFLDYRPPRSRVDIDDDAALKNEIIYVYGDSSIQKGGWVRAERIMADARDKAAGEGTARRYFLNEITVGQTDAIDMLKWPVQGKPEDILTARTKVCLGFYGSNTRESTSLCASRLSDGHLMHIKTWERPPDVPVGGWSVPRDEVHAAVAAAFQAYTVYSMFCTPQGWQTEVNTWAGQYGIKDKRLPKDWQCQVLELWLNSEMRMDQVIERFETAHRGDEITHDASAIMTRHAQNCALADGKKRASAEDRLPGQSDFYQRMVRKGQGLSISAFVAALLAYEARGWAIEKGAFATDAGPNLW